MLPAIAVGAITGVVGGGLYQEGHYAASQTHADVEAGCTPGSWTDWIGCRDAEGRAICNGTGVRVRQLYGPSCSDAPAVEERPCTVILPQGSCTDSDCAYGEWGSWSACNGSCSEDCGAPPTRFRMREILAQARGAGVPCSYADTVQIEPCQGLPLCPKPQACVPEPWGTQSYTPCPGVCTMSGEPAYQYRTRSVQTPASGGGPDCALQDLVQSRTCELPTCTPCSTTAWGDWTECSVPCGGGLQWRTRELVDPGTEEGLCLLTQSQVCNTESCPGSCSAMSWDLLSAVCVGICSGNIEEQATMSFTMADGSVTCPVTGELLDMVCPKDASGSRGCPAPQNCQPEPWHTQEWGYCSAPCGSGGGTRLRVRGIEHPAAFGGQPCQLHDLIEEIGCNDGQEHRLSGLQFTNYCPADFRSFSMSAHGTAYCKNASATCWIYAGSEEAALEGQPCYPIERTNMSFSTWNLPLNEAVQPYMQNPWMPVHFPTLSDSEAEGICSVHNCTTWMRAGPRVLMWFGPRADDLMHASAAHEPGLKQDGIAGTTVIDPPCGTPVDCSVSDWRDASACPEACGPPWSKVQTRDIVREAENGGKPCNAYVLQRTVQCTGISSCSAVAHTCLYTPWPSSQPEGTQTCIDRAPAGLVYYDALQPSTKLAWMDVKQGADQASIRHIGKDLMRMKDGSPMPQALADRINSQCPASLGYAWQKVGDAYYKLNPGGWMPWTPGDSYITDEQCPPPPQSKLLGDGKGSWSCPSLCPAVPELCAWSSCNGTCGTGRKMMTREIQYPGAGCSITDMITETTCDLNKPCQHTCPIGCDGSPCSSLSGHGSCDGNAATCSCVPGFGGEACEQGCPVNSAGRVCSGNGTCTAGSGYNCVCDAGWTGELCQTPHGLFLGAPSMKDGYPVGIGTNLMEIFLPSMTWEEAANAQGAVPSNHFKVGPGTAPMHSWIWMPDTTYADIGATRHVMNVMPNEYEAHSGGSLDLLGADGKYRYYDFYYDINENWDMRFSEVQKTSWYKKLVNAYS